MSKVYQNDRPTLRVNTGVDLLDASPGTQALLVKKPDGTLDTWVTTVETPFTGGILLYTCGATDLDQVGAYLIQAKVQRTGDTNMLPLGATVALHVDEPYT